MIAHRDIFRAYVIIFTQTGQLRARAKEFDYLLEEQVARGDYLPKEDLMFARVKDDDKTKKRILFIKNFDKQESAKKRNSEIFRFWQVKMTPTNIPISRK